ncbi:hypothetical protein SESBI_39321 [Sesbania bispinosa]|nr:hypothetical protein SESBI_39321 [Sesbania bispinosa]
MDTDSAKLAACGIDDLLSFTEGGKHDYDWLLTPPGTPDFPSSESEFKPNLAPTRSRLGRPTSNTNASRDIRNSSGTVRSLSSATLFPQSIRTPTSKAKIQQPTRGLSAPASVDNDIYRSLQSRNNRMSGRGREIDGRQYFAKLSEVEYHSSRYDALLLKEDLGNTNWLHSFDEKYDQGPIFDNGFESLPEPFALL